MIEHPLVIGNTSQITSTDPELNFFRGYNLGIIIYRFTCSLLFRRDLVLNNIGFWDSVRFVADTEYRRRIIKTFGEDSVIDLAAGPLSFYCLSTHSLTGNQAFGHPGYRMGVRKEYYESQIYHHSKAKSLYYFFPQEKRPFPVPEPMWPEYGNMGSSGRRNFDVILASDFRIKGSMGNLNVELIKSQKKFSIKTGLIQMFEYSLDPASIILHRVRNLIDGT